MEQIPGKPVAQAAAAAANWQPGTPSERERRLLYYYSLTALHRFVAKAMRGSSSNNNNNDVEVSLFSHTVVHPILPDSMAKVDQRQQQQCQCPVWGTCTGTKPVLSSFGPHDSGLALLSWTYFYRHYDQVVTAFAHLSLSLYLCLHSQLLNNTCESNSTFEKN